MRALGAILVTLVGFSGGLAIFNSRSRAAIQPCVENHRGEHE